MKQGNPLDPDTMVGAQASNDQLEKILSYLDIGRQEGVRIFQEEIFGPVLSVTKFKDDEEAISIANDTLYGLGAGVWTRDGTRELHGNRKRRDLVNGGAVQIHAAGSDG
jgi:aldehyde dehydrogenase